MKEQKPLKTRLWNKGLSLAFCARPCKLSAGPASGFMHKRSLHVFQVSAKTSLLQGSLSRHSNFFLFLFVFFYMDSCCICYFLYSHFWFIWLYSFLDYKTLQWQGCHFLLPLYPRNSVCRSLNKKGEGQVKHNIFTTNKC